MRTQATDGSGQSRSGFSTKLHACCDAGNCPLAFVPTPSQAHDTQDFGPPIRMIADQIDALLADKG